MRGDRASSVSCVRHAPIVPKTVLLLGAGASIADVATKSVRTRPPLDRDFFAVAAQASPSDARVAAVRDYFVRNYGLDVCDSEHDSLEGAMSRLYPDMFNSLLADEAQRAFRSLLQVFTDRLARTTNEIRPTQKRLLYRMLSRLLGSGSDPSDVTIITFNQDLQVEKTLELLSQMRRWAAVQNRLFCFPEMYSVADGTWERITGPTGATKSGPDLFPRSSPERDCLRVLKLHGSLNWYSTHTSSSPSRAAMLNPKRRLSVTRRKAIAPDMTLSGRRKVYTLPVIVPPVNHKSSVLPEALGEVWTLAERRLIEADEIVVFGYSCPALDFESANLLTRAQQKRHASASFAVIDPNGAVATRYIDLLSPARLTYYSSGKAYLETDAPVGAADGGRGARIR